MLGQDGRVVAQVFAQELVIGHELTVLAQKADAVVGIRRVEAHHIHALLLGAPVVVLGLHFQEVEPGVHVGTDAQFLAPGVAVLVNDVHVVVRRVEVSRVVARNAHPVDVLGAVVVVGERQQEFKPADRRDKLGVGAVHQLNATHLIESDRVICPDDIVHRERKDISKNAELNYEL